MSVVRSLRTAFVDHLRDAGLGFREVKPHIGRYSVEDLKRLHRAAPAAAIGIVNATRPVKRASGQIQIDVGFAAVIVTNAKRSDDADDDAIDLSIAVAGNLASWVPALTVRGCQPPANIHLEAVADTEIDQAGLAVWAVMWSHSVLVGVDEIAAAIGDNHHLSPDPSVTVNGGAA